MPAGLDVDMRRFHPHRPPAMLLGGVNLVRALGLAGIPAIVASRFGLMLNAPEIARALIDKARFQAFAESRGLPVPRTLDWDALGSFAAPVLVKPGVKMHGARSSLQLRFFGAAKARVYPDGRSLAADVRALELRDGLAVQEYIRGDDRRLWSFHGFADAKGELLAWFIGRKLRTYPALTGESSYIELARNAGVAYDYLVSGTRPAGTGYGTTIRWLASLAFSLKVYDLFSWSDPLPFLRHWAARIRSALARRMHRWLATAS